MYRCVYVRFPLKYEIYVYSINTYVNIHIFIYIHIYKHRRNLVWGKDEDKCKLKF